MHHPTDRIAHTTAFVTPVVEHWLEREMGPLHEGSIRRPIAPWENAFTTKLHLAPMFYKWCRIMWVMGGDRLHWWVQGSTSNPTGIIAGGGCFEVLWNLEYPVGLSQKRNSRPKVAQIGPSKCYVVCLGCPHEPWKGSDTQARLYSNCVYTCTAMM